MPFLLRIFDSEKQTVRVQEIATRTERHVVCEKPMTFGPASGVVCSHNDTAYASSFCSRVVLEGSGSSLGRLWNGTGVWGGRSLQVRP